MKKRFDYISSYKIDKCVFGKRFIIVTYKFHISAGDFLVPYLVKHSASVVYVIHSFADRKDRRSYCLTYEYRSGEKMVYSKDYRKLPETLVLLKNVLFTVYSILISRKTYDVCITLSGPETLACIFLKKLGFIVKVIYWSTDFVPNDRFEAGWKNAIYHKVNKLSVLWSDHAWDLSPRIAEGRSKIFGWAPEEIRKSKVVPMGVQSIQRGLVPFEKIDRYRLVFLGHLLEKQGVQLVIDSIPKIIEKIPAFNFLVIGTGPYENELKCKASKLGIDDHITFTGFIESHSDVDRLLSECACAVAPYDIRKDTWTYWADPGKIKSYFAASLPVILTNVSYNAPEIERRRCGIIINYDVDELVRVVLKLMTDRKLLEEYRLNSYEYSKTFDWNNIFNKAFEDVFRK